MPSDKTLTWINNSEKKKIPTNWKNINIVSLLNNLFNGILKARAMHAMMNGNVTTPASMTITRNQSSGLINRTILIQIPINFHNDAEFMLNRIQPIEIKINVVHIEHARTTHCINGPANISCLVIPARYGRHIS